MPQLEITSHRQRLGTEGQLGDELLETAGFILQLLEAAGLVDL